MTWHLVEEDGSIQELRTRSGIVHATIYFSENPERSGWFWFPNAQEFHWLQNQPTTKVTGADRGQLPQVRAFVEAKVRGLLEGRRR